MNNLVQTVAGGILLAAGVAAVVIHYAVEGNDAYSYLTLVIAAVLLLAGWMLFDRGAGMSRRWGDRGGGPGNDSPGPK